MTVLSKPDVPRAFAFLFLLLPCIVAASLPTSAQTGAEADVASEPFFEAVDVEIINVDVRVTGKDGEPIEGLRKEDFVVYRDGAPVEVANFYAVAGGRPVPVPADAPRSLDPQPEPAPIPTMAEPESQVAPEHRLWVIAYVDNFNLHPIERNRVLPDLELFLMRAVDAGGRVMVVSYNRSLEMRQPFTDQRQEVALALGALRDDAGLASLRRRDQAATLRQIDEADSPDQALLIARLYAEEQMNAVGYTVDALDRLIETLGGLPGRKALVHVSSGVPMLAGEEMFHAVAEKFGARGAYSQIPRHDTTRKFESLDRRANANRVSFYTLDAGGLRGFQFGAAEYGGFVNTKLRGVLDSVVPENLQAPLRLMAEETGGRAIVNRNEVLPALEEVRHDFESFYSLGISSVDADSGRYHDIKVELRDRVKGTTLRYRSGYRSKSVETRVRERLRAALSYALEENPLAVEVAWGPQQRQPGGSGYILPVQLRVPLGEIALMPVGTGRHEARLKLFVGAVGRDGRVSEIDGAPFGVRLADENVEAAKRESLVHTHKLLLERGRQKVGVAILDVFGSQSSVVTGIVQIGPEDRPDER